jgi:predicted anti-sigma-YlaC factor YlaD
MTMNRDDCQTIRPLLVDYSDGELASDASQPVAEHLAQCAGCRAELRALETSLALVRKAWNEPAYSVGDCPDLRVNENGTVPFARSSKVARRRTRRLIARWAAPLGVGAAVGAAVVLVLLHWPPGRSAVTPQPLAAGHTDSNSLVPAEALDVMERIAREGRSARLAASVVMLAQEPSLKQYKDNAERYLRATYADTAAVRMLDREEKAIP